jgi:hypothetical protein
VLLRARLIAVTDRESEAEADRLLATAIRLKAEVKRSQDPLCAAADAAHKAATRERARLMAPFEAAEQLLGRKLIDWRAELRRRSQEAQRLAEIEARRIEEERRLAEAEALEAAGETREAVDSILAAPVVAPPVVVPQQDLEASSVQSTITTWEAEIVDEAAIPREYLTPDMARIRKVVSALKGQTSIPGVRAVPRERVRLNRRQT